METWHTESAIRICMTRQLPREVANDAPAKHAVSEMLSCHHNNATSRWGIGDTVIVSLDNLLPYSVISSVLGLTQTI